MPKNINFLQESSKADNRFADPETSGQITTSQDSSNADNRVTDPEASGQSTAPQDTGITKPEALASKDTLREQHVVDGQFALVAYLCSTLEIPKEDLLTEDVVSHPEFMRTLSDVCASYKEYYSLLKTWQANQSFVKKGCKLSQKLNEVDENVKFLKSELIALSQIKILTTNLSVQLKSCQQKMNKMMEMLPIFFNTKKATETAIYSLQCALRAQRCRKFNKLTGDGEYHFISSNSLSLSWEAACEKIAELECNDNLIGVFTPLTSAELKLFPGIKDRCHYLGFCGIPAQALLKHYQSLDYNTIKPAVYQLLDFFPLLCLEKGKQYVLVDYTELQFRPNLVHELLTIDQHPQIDEANVDEVANDIGAFINKKTGPDPLQKKYPELLTVMMDFIKLHGFGAHIRRRTGTATSCGVKLEDIRQHVLKNVEGLEKISRSKIHTLLKPKRENTRQASLHKDCLDVRVGSKNCDVSNENPNAHEYFAATRNIREMCAMYSDECTIFSCDSKAKVHIGGQAVSRYHQLRTFFPTDDQPHYHDHDFPICGYLIEPDGYLLLKKEATDDSNVQPYTDK